MRGKIKDYVITYDRKQYLTLILNENFAEEFERLKEKEISIEVKAYREKRSLNANALCWKLCTEIANVMRISKDILNHAKTVWAK